MATITHPRVRNVAPNVFGGKQEDWDEFACKLMIFTGLQGTSVARMIKMAETKTEPIKDESMLVEPEKKVDELTLSRHVFFVN